MKAKLLRKIRKKYSYIWRNEVMSDYTTIIDGQEIRRVETRLLLVVVNERTKKAEHLFTEPTVSKNIEEFLKAVIYNDYWYYKRQKEEKRRKRSYLMFKRRQKQIFPAITLTDELKALPCPQLS